MSRRMCHLVWSFVKYGAVIDKVTGAVMSLIFLVDSISQIFFLSVIPGDSGIQPLRQLPLDEGFLFHR